MKDIKVVGKPATKIEMVPVNMAQFEGQRRLKIGRANKFLTDMGEFDWNLFGVATVAQYPNGSREMINGGHRTFMAQQIDPTIEFVPAHIVEVKTVKEAAKLFYRMNGVNTTALNPEEVMVNRVLGGEKYALELVDALKDCNWKVTNKVLSVGDELGKSIKIRAFEKMYKISPDTLNHTADIINLVFKDEGSVNVMLVQGIGRLIEFIDNRDVFAKYQYTFLKFLTSLEQTGRSQRSFTYPQLRKDNHYAISVAWGLYGEWYTWLQKNDKSMTPFPKNVLEKVYLEAGMEK